MKFNLQSSLYYLINGPSTIFASLRCLENDYQTIADEKLTTDRQIEWEDLRYGLADNRFTRFSLETPGPLMIQYESVADIYPQLLNKSDVEDDGVRSIHSESMPYLFPSRYAPSDRLRAVAIDQFGGIKGKLNQALAVEQWIWERITYQHGSSDEKSSAIDTLENRKGVCRDFAHLGIAFCRALTIPARYVTVYSCLLDPQDFHAVFEVLVGGRWYLIDATRKAPLNGMVRIAMGRDASDAAVATLFGNIQGNGINVSTLISNEETTPFQPLYRQDLEENNQVISTI
ncbi:MAG: transglutaminase family protein [Verrucomicrobiales bacterium]|nr:transglutaminase family protein [Verrucomicrobiales bacterium]